MEFDDLLIEFVGPLSNLRQPPGRRKFGLQEALGIAVTRDVLNHDEYATHPRVLRELRDSMEINAPWVRRVVRFESDLTAMLFALGRNVLKEARELGAIGLGDYRCDGFD